MQQGWYAFTPEDEFDFQPPAGPFISFTQAEAQADDLYHSTVGYWDGAEWEVMHNLEDKQHSTHRPPHTQSRIDSFMEAVTNTAFGLAVSQVANLTVLPAVLKVQVSQSAALSIGVIYTVISLVRQYVLRRAFDGRSPWQALKHGFSACMSRVSRYG